MNLKSKNNSNISAFTAENSSYTSPVIGWQAITDFNALTSDLALLENQIKQNTRSIQYWDVYRFSDSVESKEDFADKWAALANNHALVINANFDSYNIGDVVIKTDDGNQVTVGARQNGFFAPVSYENGVLKYEYRESNETSDVDITIGTGDNSVLSCYAIQHTHPESEASFSFSKISGVDPLIKFYTNDGEKEELSVSYKITSDDTQYTLSELPAVDAIIVVK